MWGPSLAVLPRLVLEASVLFASYLGMILYAVGQRHFYFDLIRELAKGSSKPPLESAAT
jgi:hypothetical protein